MVYVVGIHEFQLGSYHVSHDQFAVYDLFHVVHFVIVTVVCGVFQLLHVHQMKVLFALVGLFRVKVFVSIL